MDKKVKRLWLKALKTLPPTKRVLRDDKGYDILGALCEVHRLNSDSPGFWHEEVLDIEQPLGDDNPVVWKYAGAWLALPEDVAIWAGIKPCDKYTLTDPLIVIDWSDPRWAGDEELYKKLTITGWIHTQFYLSTFCDAGYTFEELAILIKLFM